jgi:urease accessory protein
MATADRSGVLALAMDAAEPGTTISSGLAACQARLELGFGVSFDATRLHTRRHSGPLRVQKPLYPEGPDCCHAIIVHPPGGIVGGDQLTLTARLDAHSQVLLTTPGAAKWYKANPQSGFASAQQTVNLHLAAGARLEWWPQETIFFDAARVSMLHTVDLAPDAAYIGCEILCFGRTASGERFASGQVAQQSRIRRGGRWLWYEQGVLQAGTAGQHSRFGLAGHSVCATLLAVAPEAGVAPATGAAQHPAPNKAMSTAPVLYPAELIEQIRQLGGQMSGQGQGRAGQFGVSQIKSLLVVRLLCDSSELARSVMTAVWALLRPHLMQRALVLPRIWQT